MSSDAPSPPPLPPLRVRRRLALGTVALLLGSMLATVGAVTGGVAGGIGRGRLATRPGGRQHPLPSWMRMGRGQGASKMAHIRSSRSRSSRSSSSSSSGSNWSGNSAPLSPTARRRKRGGEERGEQAAAASTAEAPAPSDDRRRLSFCWLKAQRGGSSTHEDPFQNLAFGDGVDGAAADKAARQQRSPSPAPPDRIKVLVKTDSGFKDMDQKLDLVLDGSNTTIADVKQILQKQMSGSPPVRLQRLFYAGRKLQDAELVGDVMRHDKEDDEEEEGRMGGRPAVALPIVLDMPPPLPHLDYEGMLALKVRFESLDFKQPLFYAANAVGLRYAIQALDEHLLRGRPTEGEEDEEEDEEDEEEGGEEARTRRMKDEVIMLKEYLKQHEQEMPPPSPVKPNPYLISAVVRELGVPGLEEIVKSLAVQLNFDWGRTCRYAFAAYLFGKFGAQGPWKPLLLCMVPGFFLLQLKPFRYGAKVAWEMMAVSPLVGGFSSALLSAPQQVLLTFDEQAYLERLYGEGGGVVPPPMGPPPSMSDLRGAGGGRGEEEDDEYEDDEDEGLSMETQAGNEREKLGEEEMEEMMMEEEEEEQEEEEMEEHEDAEEDEEFVEAEDYDNGGDDDEAEEEEEEEEE